jgi:LssY C-terminus
LAVIRELRVGLGGAACILLAGGCAGFHPHPQENPSWRQRALTQTRGDITVSVVALDAREAREEFGVDLENSGIQPVWIQVENREQMRYFIPPLTVDPAYYSSYEAAWTGHEDFSPDKNRRIDDYFRERRLPASVDPGRTASGFLFTTLDQGVKYVNLELIGAGAQQVRRFSFLAPVPGLRIDYQAVHWDKLYPPGEILDLDEAGLRAWLEKMPACTKGGDQKTDADPVNFVLIGSHETVFAALVRRGWHVTEVVSLSSVWDMAKSSMFDTRFAYAPVSPLHFFGRRQDLALQKPRGDVNQRNHLRLWLAPVRLNGTPVWIGQISRDIGVRLTHKTGTTHKVDPDMDDTRWYLLQDMFFSEGLARLAWVKGGVAATPQAPLHNYTGDPYFTDGLRLVMWLSDQPVGYHQVEIVPWATPPER